MTARPMRIVAECVIRPNHCAAIPILGSAHRKGYFDTLSEMPGFDNHVYVSVEFVEQRAAELGWMSPLELESAAGARIELEERAAQLEAENAQLKAQLDAVQILTHSGFKVGSEPKITTSRKAA